jgi:glycosyltransferase involved in cell wall biosynthesis
MSEVIRADVCGSLIDARDEQGFASALTQWLRHPKRIEEVLARKRLATERFELSQHIERLREIHGA